MKRILLTTIGLGIVLSTALAVYFVCTTNQRYDDTFTDQEKRNLQNIEAWLSTGANPESVHLAIALSEDGLSRALAQLNGVRAASDTLGGLDLEITGTQVDIQPGYLQLSLSLEVTHHEMPFPVTFTAQGVLLVSGVDIEPGRAGVSHAHYQIAIREVRAKLGKGLSTFQSIGWARKILASHVAKRFAESLRFSLPIDFPIDLGLGFYRSMTHKTEHGEFQIQYRMSEPQLTADSAIHVVPSIPTRDAIWFLGAIATKEDVDDILRGVHRPQPGEPQAEIHALRRSVARLVDNFPALNEDIAIYVNAEFFHTALKAFNNLSEEHRRIDAQLTARREFITKSFKKRGLVGSGGYSIRFLDDKSLSGTVFLSPLTATWTDGTGLSLSGDVKVTAKAGIEIHIDPFIGGGFKTPLMINGSTTVPLKVQLDSRHISLQDGTTAAVIGPAISCVRFPLRLEAGGTIPFGAITDQFVGKEQLDPQIIMSSDVHWSRLAAKGQKGILQFDDDYWAGFRIVPKNVIAHVGGYKFIAQTDSLLAKGKRPKPALNSKQRESIKDIWKSRVEQTCLEARPPTYLFAGLEFGPNNVLVKSLGALASGANLAGEIVALPWNVLETSVTDPKRALGKLKTELDEVVSGTEESIKDILSVIGVR